MMSNFSKWFGIVAIMAALVLSPVASSAQGEGAAEQNAKPAAQAPPPNKPQEQETQQPQVNANSEREPGAPQETPPAARDENIQLARDIFKQLIEINTTDSVGSTTVAAQAMAKRLQDAGFPESDIVVMGPNDRKGNMVARLRAKPSQVSASSGRERGAPISTHKPVLLIGHLDVVEARRSDWTYDPFQFVYHDGYFYGRGTQDMKDGDAIMVATLMRLKKEGFQPDRDIILALTADEEGGSSNGVEWLVKNHRDLVDAEFVMNSDTASVNVENGKPLLFEVDASEKLYSDFQLSTTNPGGHSSIPRPENAIYELTNALDKIQRYQFPFELNPITRAELEAQAKVETGQKAADIRGALKTPPDQQAVARMSQDPVLNSTVRTTCVATRLAAGHANNALPQTATANVNCRILPGHPREEVRQQLIKVINDPRVTVQYVTPQGPLAATAPSDFAPTPTAIPPQVMQPLQQVVNEMWPGLPIVPTMSTGATDGIYTRPAGMPTYAILGVAIANDDIRAHGKDERIPVKSFDDGVDFYYRFIKALTGKNSSQ